MQPTQLKRSKKGLQINLALVSIAAIVFALITSWMASVVFRWTEYNGVMVILIIWAVFVLGWGLGAIKLLLNWRKEHYELTADSLVSYGKANSLGMSKAIYPYETITSMRMAQGNLGKRFGYGDVYISLSTPEGEVIMHDIEHPLEKLAELQRLVGKRGVVTHAPVN